ncbi:MAG: hypothetical protein CV087_24030, partial [Candidatus Brocadia sp. WS118]
MKFNLKIFIICLIILYGNLFSQDTIIKSFSGTGVQNTRPFLVENGWEIQWDAKGDIFQLFLYTSKGELVGVAANQQGPGKGASFQAKKGHYYLQVNAIDKWTINIVQTNELISNSSNAKGQTKINYSEVFIVAGKGWGKVSLGIEKKIIESDIGEGQERSQFEEVYFIDYPAVGIQCSYNTKDNTLRAIFFYNRQHGYENFETFQGKTDHGIDWSSTPEQVIKAYGKPKEEYIRVGWRR